MVLSHRITGNIEDANKAYGTTTLTETGTDKGGMITSTQSYTCHFSSVSVSLKARLNPL